ncbi:TRM-domain-containing protein [Rostrohypoxylon terebratum]|nr:TRM-domain-containing protein [Rostrohypoxylon terebratum]
MTSKTKNGNSAAPTEIPIITRDGRDFTEAKEGLARILVPFTTKDASDKTLKNVEEQQNVFYNPIQQFNRDLTVLAIKAYGQDILAKRRPANADRVSKRKRDRSDVGRDNPKKQEKAKDAEEAAQGDTPIKPIEGEEEKPAEAKQSGLRFTILDALSATGLRALRYAQELPFVTSVTANDLSPTAVEAIKRNAEYNGVSSVVNATVGDARAHMYSLLTQEEADDAAKDKHRNKKGGRNTNKPKKYDVIDLDPYGTAAPFFDAALNAVRDDGGLLCVTCTDSGVFASNGYPEKAFALYGGVPVKGFHSHEVGLRLILHGLTTTAARYGLAIEPLLSLSIDYYVRIFVKVKKSPAQVKFLAGKAMVVYNCDQGCGAWETQYLARNRKAPNKSGVGVFYKHGFNLAPTADQLCKECNSKMHLAGPMYGGPLHSTDFIQKILDELPNASDDVYGTKPRIKGMLQTALEEFLPAPKDDLASCKEDEYAAIEPYPFYFHPTSMARTVHCICPDEDSFRGALRHLGYHVTRSHCKRGSLKTDAPWSHPINVDKVKEHSPACVLLRLGEKEKEKNEAAKDEATENETSKGETVMNGNTKDETAKDSEQNKVDKLEIVFDRKLGRDTSKAGLVRYQPNPKENWGPQIGSGSDLASVKSEEVALVLRRPQGINRPESYDIYSLKEEGGHLGPSFHLSRVHSTSAPQRLIISDRVPKYLRSGPSRHLHVVVSIGSGTGLALKFYNSVLRTLLYHLNIHVLEPSADLAERSKPGVCNLVITQHANTIRDFASELRGSSQATVQHTVILLSGDGGVVDFLNARPPTEGPDTEANLPLIAILPLGTGNAHFHSQHRLSNGIPEFPEPSSLVRGLRTLFNGEAAPLPSFKAEFPLDSRIITFENSDTGVSRVSSDVSCIYGGIVASYGFHSQLVWESDTPEYRKYGAERFKMVGQQLLQENHAYHAIVELDRDRHAYILVAMVSNLEKTFTISPSSKPLDGQLRLVHFGVVSGEKTMEIMMQAYNGGRHVDMKWTTDDGKEEGVGYDKARVVKITTLEEDDRWRNVCIDGTIVELPQGGTMTVKTEDEPRLQVLVDRSVA